jgi:hypothetical protein
MHADSFFAIRTSDSEDSSGLNKASVNEVFKKFIGAHKKNLKPDLFHADE